MLELYNENLLEIYVSTKLTRCSPNLTGFYQHKIECQLLMSIKIVQSFQSTVKKIFVDPGCDLVQL
jgi:hypothetical protein